MVQTKKAKTGQQTDAGAGGSGVSLGKGAWDADQNCLIPPEAEVGGNVRRANTSTAGRYTICVIHLQLRPNVQLCPALAGRGI